MCWATGSHTPFGCNCLRSRVTWPGTQLGDAQPQKDDHEHQCPHRHNGNGGDHQEIHNGKHHAKP